MALLTTPFEQMSNVGLFGFNGKDFDKAVEDGGKITAMKMDELLEQSRVIEDGWVNSEVVNKNGRRFGITDDLCLCYADKQGNEHKDDLTEYAFSQLCSRVGVPAGYVKKCLDAKKPELALENFFAWADDYKGNLKIMKNDGIARAVLSEGYVPFNSHKIITTMNKTFDYDRWNLVQSYLSEDKMVLRFIDSKSPIFEDKDSKLYIGLIVRSSEIGNGALSIQMFVYRQRCTNGMIVSKGDATLYKQIHAGDMKYGKVEDFSRAMYKARTYGDRFARAMDACNKERLSDTEFKLWIEKTQKDLKLSKKSVETLQDLIRNNYDRSVWGVINGITELSQKSTLDGRLELEEYAGKVFHERLAMV